MKIIHGTCLWLLLTGAAFAQTQAEWNDAKQAAQSTTCSLPGEAQDLTAHKTVEQLNALRTCLLKHRATVEAAYRAQRFTEKSVQSLSDFDRDTEVAWVAVERASKAAVDRNAFLGFNWGVGFGFSEFDSERVAEAAVVDGVVRATKKSAREARAFLEYHWFPQGLEFNLGSSGIIGGFGPFLAVSVSEEEVLAGVGGGLMLGFKDSSGAEGFSVGVGYMLDNNVRTLAKGFAESEPLPAGEAAVRYTESSETSVVIFVTRSFGI